MIVIFFLLYPWSKVSNTCYDSGLQWYFFSFLQVILDVVCNHTNEADDANPYTTSFRGIDNKVILQFCCEVLLVLHSHVPNVLCIKELGWFYVLLHVWDTFMSIIFIEKLFRSLIYNMIWLSKKLIYNMIWLHSCCHLPRHN